MRVGSLAQVTRTTNSFLMRHVASGPSFDPNLEYSPDPGFDNSAAWPIKTGCTVSGSALNASGSGNQFCEAPATATIQAGTYRIVGTIGSVTDFMRVVFGGAQISFIDVGPIDELLVVTTPTNNNIRYVIPFDESGSFLDCSIKRVA